MNYYTYILSNPLKYTDPSGYIKYAATWPDFPGGGGGGTFNYSTNSGLPDSGHWSERFSVGNQGYSYDDVTGEYIENYSGKPVAYETVYNNYIQPNSSSSYQKQSSVEGMNFYTISISGKTALFSTTGAIKSILATSEGSFQVLALGAGLMGIIDEMSEQAYADALGLNIDKYYNYPLFYINSALGVASTGATVKGGYQFSNELYH